MGTLRTLFLGLAIMVGLVTVVQAQPAPELLPPAIEADVYIAEFRGIELRNLTGNAAAERAFMIQLNAFRAAHIALNAADQNPNTPAAERAAARLAYDTVTASIYTM